MIDRHPMTIVAAERKPLPAQLPLPPFEAFQAVWERDARWLMGPGLLADIVLWLRGRSLVAKMSGTVPGRVDIELPLPTIEDAASGRRHSVIGAVPEELKVLFLQRCQLVLDTRKPIVEHYSPGWFRQKATIETLARVNSELFAAELELTARGEMELWQVAAESFGFRWHGLPDAAGLVR